MDTVLSGVPGVVVEVAIAALVLSVDRGSSLRYYTVLGT